MRTQKMTKFVPEKNFQSNIFDNNLSYQNERGPGKYLCKAVNLAEFKLSLNFLSKKISSEVKKPTQSLSFIT